MAHQPVAIVAILVLSACEWGGGTDAKAGFVLPDAKRPVDGPRPDGPRVDGPVGLPDASIDGTAAAVGHLLLTEVTLAPTGSKFVEIYNPTAQAIDLTRYYLSNYTTYYTLPLGPPTLPGGHFIVQFPPASSIPAQGVITIATDTAAAFNTAYGANPTYSIADATVIVTASFGTPTLTTTGALVVLFRWDGTSGLVADVDIMIAGNAAAPTNTLSMNKSGITQNGATYATDLDTIAVQATTPGSGTSTKRILAETGHETQAGNGNGITGHDETSEDTAATWDTTFTAPTPGTVPAGL